MEATQYHSSSLRASDIVLPARRLRKEPSLVWAFARSFAGASVTAALFKLVHDLLVFASPQLLRYLYVVTSMSVEPVLPNSLSLSLSLSLRLMINFTKSSSEPGWRGYFYAVLLLLVGLVQSLFLQQYFHHCLVVGMRMRTAVIAAVYNKVSSQDPTTMY